MNKNHITITKGNSNIETIANLFKEQNKLAQADPNLDVYHDAKALSDILGKRLNLVQIDSYFDVNTETCITTFIFSHNPTSYPKLYADFDGSISRFLSRYNDLSENQGAYHTTACPELNLFIGTFTI